MSDNPSLGRAILQVILDTSRLRDDWREIEEEIEDELSGLEETANGTMTSLADSLGDFGAAMSASVTAPITAMGTGFLWAASAAEETATKFDAVFGEIRHQARAWTEDLAERTNRSSIALEDFMATLQDTLVPMGFARDEAYEMSSAITELGIDLASFDNIDPSEAIDLLTSAMVGNHEAVRRFGIVINEASLEQEILNMNLGHGVDAATAQEKAMARMNLILRATKDAQGDAERTSQSLANQFQGLQGAIRDVSVEFGQQMIPTAKEVIATLRQAIQVISDLDEETKFLLVSISAGVALLGPLALGISGAIHAVQTLRSAMIGLRVAMVFMGPGGLIAGAIALLAGGAGLAYAMGRAGQSGDDLRVSMEGIKAEAEDLNLGLGDLSSVTRDDLRLAIQDLASEMDGPAKAAFVEYANEAVRSAATIEEAYILVGREVARLRAERLQGAIEEQEALVGLYGEQVRAAEGSVRQRESSAGADYSRRAEENAPLIEELESILPDLEQQLADAEQRMTVVRMNPDLISEEEKQSAARFLVEARTELSNLQANLQSLRDESVDAVNNTASARLERANEELAEENSRLEELTEYQADLYEAAENGTASELDILGLLREPPSQSDYEPTESTPVPGGSEGDTGIDSGGGSQEDPRVPQDVFDDVARLGAASMREAEAIGTLESSLADVQNRANLVGGAITELITDFNFSPQNERVQYLVGRLSELRAEQEGLQEQLQDTPDETPVQDIYDSLADALENVDDRYTAFGDSVDVAAEKQNVLRNAINALIREGVDPASDGIQSLLRQIEDLNEAEETGLSSEAMGRIEMREAEVRAIRARNRLIGEGRGLVEGLLGQAEELLTPLVEQSEEYERQVANEELLGRLTSARLDSSGMTARERAQVAERAAYASEREADLAERHQNILDIVLPLERQISDARQEGVGWLRDAAEGWDALTDSMAEANRERLQWVRNEEVIEGTGSNRVDSTGTTSRERAQISESRGGFLTPEQTQTLDDMEAALDQVDARAEMFGDTTGVVADKQAILKEAIQRLIDLGLSKESEELRELIKTLKATKEETAQFTAEILALEDLKGSMRRTGDIALSVLGDMAQAAANVLGKLDEGAKSTEDMVMAIGDAFADSEDKVLAFIGGMASGIASLAKGIASKDPAAIIAGIMDIVSAIAGAMDWNRKLINQALKDWESWEDRFAGIMNPEALKQMKSISSGFLGLGSTEIFDEEASEFGLSIADHIAGGVEKGLRAGMTSYLDTGEIGDLEAKLYEGIYSGVETALFDAIIHQGIMQELLGDLLLALSQAVAEGARTGDMSRAKRIMGQIQEAVGPAAAAIAGIIDEFEGVLPEGREKESTTGRSGTQVREFTGETRSLLIDLLTPLSALPSAIPVLADIRGILDRRLPSGGALGAQGAGGAGMSVNFNEGSIVINSDGSDPQSLSSGFIQEVNDRLGELWRSQGRRRGER